MRRIVLFSEPGGTNFDKILDSIFPDELENKVLAYMPSNGASTKEEYTNYWKDIAKRFQAEFRFIDNSKSNSAEESVKLLASNILVITGGNTFGLLNNLRNSGLDKAIKQLLNKDEFIIAGFSAGALVLTPNINVCNLPKYDENKVELTDLTALNIVNFEVFPHYSEAENKELLESYRKTTNNIVREITNDGYLILDLA